MVFALPKCEHISIVFAVFFSFGFADIIAMSLWPFDKSYISFII